MDSRGRVRSQKLGNGAGKGGVGILRASQFARLVTLSKSIMNSRVVWIRMERLEGGIACIYAPNVPSHVSLLWQEMTISLTKGSSWVLGGNFNMTQCPEVKSQDCNQTISDLERFSWNSLIEKYGAKRVVVRSTIQWKDIEDKSLRQFFQAV